MGGSSVRLARTSIRSPQSLQTERAERLVDARMKAFGGKREPLPQKCASHVLAFAL